MGAVVSLVPVEQQWRPSSATICGTNVPPTADLTPRESVSILLIACVSWRKGRGTHQPPPFHCVHAVDVTTSDAVFGPGSFLRRTSVITLLLQLRRAMWEVSFEVFPALSRLAHVSRQANSRSELRRCNTQRAYQTQRTQGRCQSNRRAVYLCCTGKWCLMDQSIYGILPFPCSHITGKFMPTPILAVDKSSSDVRPTAEATVWK